jgi:hypothetical protein
MFITSLIGPVVGGLLGGEGNSQTSSTQNKIDPRMDPYIYGEGGILPAAAAWYNQNQSGLNPQMLTGLNNQWLQLGASKPGYDTMQNLGLSMMGGGVMGNPFSNGTMANGGTMPAPMQGSQGTQSPQPYQPAQFSGAGPFTMPTMAPRMGLPSQFIPQQRPDDPRKAQYDNMFGPGGGGGIGGYVGGGFNREIG